MYFDCVLLESCLRICHRPFPCTVRSVEKAVNTAYEPISGKNSLLGSATKIVSHLGNFLSFSKFCNFALTCTVLNEKYLLAFWL